MKRLLHLRKHIWRLSLLLNSGMLLAQPAVLDTSFMIGTGANNGIQHLSVQPNDKIIIAGAFNSFNGVTANRIARLLPDGAVDNTWITSGGGANSNILATALQPDGKTLLGGVFTTYNGITANRLLRLDTVGNIDTTFMVGAGPNNEVRGIEANANRVIMHGFFNQYQGTPVPNFAVLLPNGQRDTTFILPSQTFLLPTDIKLLPNNKFYISGNFSMYNNHPANRLARINPDGSVDTSFHTGTGFNAQVRSIVVQQDGRVLLSGSFSTYNGIPVSRVIRLHTNGSLDTTFNTTLPQFATVTVLNIDNQGRIFIAGSNSGFLFFKRLLPNGSEDTSFNTGTGFNGSITSVKFQSNQKILVSGDFTNYQGISSRRIARLWPDSCLAATPPVIHAQSQTINCPGGSTVLQVNTPPNNQSTQWNWYADSCLGTPIGTGDSIVVSPVVSTTYFVAGGGQCIGGCSQVFIEIVADTAPPVPNLPNLPALTGLCEVMVTQIPTATDSCIGPVSATTQSPLSYSAKGNYTILWTYDDGQNISTQTQNVTVTGMDATLRLDTISLEITANYSSSSAQYQWLYCDSNMTPIPGATQLNYLPATSGNYAVAITDSGCTDTSGCVQINVSNIGLQDITFGDILVFPNPATGILQVELSETPDKISIYSMAGTLIRMIHPNTNQLAISVSDFPSGIYLLEVLKDDTRELHRFAVE